MTWLSVAQLVAGSVLLILGAEGLIRGGSRLALAFGVSPLVIGLTVVAFGTSAPEFAVTARAAYQGAAAVALGNVVGSNIFNILFILGLSAVVAPLIVSVQLVRTDVPIMIGASLLMAGLGVDGSIGRLDGALLFSGILGYTFFLIRQSRRETLAAQAEYEGAYGGDEARKSRIVVNLLFVTGGMVMLGLGGDWLVLGATDMARAFGVSELVIGLTVVAVGTSLPEVATSVLASVRGERDIAVGNLVGSNLFNLLAVLGLGGLIAPEGIPVPSGAMTFDIPIMIGAAIAALPIFFTGYTIARWEGALLTGFYLAYVAVILMEAADHPALEGFGMAMTYFVIPLTAITLAARAYRAWHQQEPLP
ncbi:MAG: calcium/sodium antiporter [Acidobacteria bacterium]|nr:calcium/sodium antiporter [Acidobacteriota bacterium]MBA3888602.1 calcium/sodium antiporter [Acidobacteriota bacterium]